MIQTMNRKYLRMASVAALLALAACSQDELTESAGTLPEGKYPLEIGSVTLAAEVDGQPWSTDAPQTRVSENTDGNSSRFDWNGSEQIGVQLYTDGEAATYTLNQDKTLTPVNGTLYWKNKEAATVMAWYPVAGTVSLADQSQGLAYVLKSSGTGKYDTPVTLNFSHALSKIRVKLEGDKATDVTKVSIESYTSCTNTNGTVSTEGASTGEIVMHKADGNIYEANVVPNQEITKFKVNDGEWVNLTVPVTPIAGSYHIITINAESKYYTVTGDYTVEGKHKPIIITGTNPTVTFRNAYMTSDDMSLIQIAEGCSPKLVFEGETMLYRPNRKDFPLIAFPNKTKLSIEVKSDAKLAMISNDWGIFEDYNNYETLDISGGGELYLESNTNARPPIVVGPNSILNISGVTLTAVATECWGNTLIPFTPAIGIRGNIGSTRPTIKMKNCTLRLYTQTTGADAEHWVYVDLGTATPDVDNVLKDKEWGVPVDVGDEVKATKYKTPADAKPDWVDKLLNQ